jgi:hypothetical protein
MKRKDHDIDRQAVRTNLHQHVEQLSVKIGERHLWKEGSLNEAADYIESVFRTQGYAATRQNFSAYGKGVCNILAETEGQNKGNVVVGAHYDTVPGSPGADDNASSIAILLELSRLMQEGPASKRIIFAAFVNEESPCFGTGKMGSMVYAQHLKEIKKTDVEVMISLEMLGYFRNNEPQRYPFSIMKYIYPRTADFLAVVGNYDAWKYVSSLKKGMRKNAAIKVRSLIVPEQVGGINRSDNSAFWEYGYRAVMLTDTANYRNKNYHQETDMIDTLNFDIMTEIVRGLYYTLKHF